MSFSDEQFRANAEALGEETLRFQTIEECGELIKALSKYNRTLGIGQPTEVTQRQAWHDVLREIADVRICITQLEFLTNSYQDVSKYMDMAIHKVAKRMKCEVIDDEFERVRITNRQ